MAEVARTRLARLRAAMAEVGLDALWVRDTSNIRWLTGFDGVFDGESAHALYVDARRAVLHTDSRYSGACEAAAQDTEIEVDSEKVSHAEAVARLWAHEPLGIESTISLAEYRALEKAFGGCDCFVETAAFVSGLRAVKDAEEISRMKAAQAITDAAFAHIVGFMRPGLTEREVQLELDDFMRRRGADDLAFSSIVATGANGANPHAIPGETRLEAGQCVVLDFGARVRGYCSDMTRTVFLGAPDQCMQDAYAALVCANEEVEALLRPGVTGKQAHQLAEDILEAAGFGGKMGHGLGHGVGLDVHESPSLNLRNDAPLAAGNVVTVEPGIYLPGRFGMRLEDFGVITESGFDVFTRSGHDMVVL